MEVVEPIEIADFGEVCRFCLQHSKELQPLFPIELDGNGLNSTSPIPKTFDYFAVRIKELTGLEVGLLRLLFSSENICLIF